MVNRPKAIGTRAETAVVRMLREHGFPHAERRALHGVTDLGDITGIPGVVIEVKGGDAAKSASDKQVTDWLAEAEIERANAKAAVAVLVMQRTRSNPRDWWAVVSHLCLADLTSTEPVWVALTAWIPVRLRLVELCHLLRHAGYGDPCDCEDI